MTKVLILGGTAWLSGLIARRWVGTGAQVTCVARGTRPVPEGATLVRADRDDADPYGELHGEWDEIVDVSRRVHHARGAVAALGARAARWTYISSVSVYADDVTPGTDESAETLAPAQDCDEYEYGAQKVASEVSVRSLGDRARIVRPGLIVGPGDPSDRFGYWAAAFVEADDQWLRTQGVEFWAGEHSLPLWLPMGMSGFTTRSNDAFRAAGGMLTSLEKTIERVVDDERARGVHRERRAGLTRAQETALLTAL